MDLLGYGKAHAYGAMVAAGYWSRDEVDRLVEEGAVVGFVINNKGAQEWYEEILSSGDPMLLKLHLERKGDVGFVEQFVDRLIELGQRVIGKGH